MAKPRDGSRFPVRPGGATPNRSNGPIAGAPGTFFSPAVRAEMPDSLLAVAWRRRWPILICVVVAIAAAFAYAEIATPIYTSMSRLYLEYVNVLPLTSEPGRLPQTQRYLETQAGLLRSRPIVAAAVETLEQRPLQTFRGVDIPEAFVVKYIRVSVGRKDDIISIEFDSPYPVEAAQIVNGVVEAYMASRSLQERQNAAQVLQILQKDLSRQEEQLLQKQAELQEFQTNHMPLSLGSETGGIVVQRHLEELQTELTRARTTVMDAQSFRDAAKALAENVGALRQYVKVQGGVNSYLSSTAEKSSLETRLVELDLQIGELSDRLTSDHPMVTALTNQRANVKATLRELDDRFLSDVLAAAEQWCDDAVDHERRIAALYEEQRGQIVALSSEVTQYQQLSDEIVRLTKYAETVEQQVGEIARIVNEDVGQLKMAILEPALPARDPSWPKKGRIVAIALVLGLLFGGFLALVTDWLDQTLRSTEEISAVLGLRVLGSVPAMSRGMTVQQRGRRVLLKSDSHEAEAFRTVRTAVFFSAPKDRAKILLITSPESGDGKSTLVSNLAITIAQAGQRTLILDADFRRPSQFSIFGLDHYERCLSSVFAGRMKLAEAIQTSGVNGLHILTCGRGIPNPAEVLNSERFALLLESLAKAYDRVLVDAPPVTVVTDAQILGARCDVTLLVLKADKSSRRAAQRAIEALQSVGTSVLGVVVNSVSKSGDRYGYYYGRHRRYYGSDSGNGGECKSQPASARVGARRSRTVGEIEK